LTCGKSEKDSCQLSALSYLLFCAEEKSEGQSKHEDEFEKGRNMINPLKLGEMLSQANQMQEEVQRKLGETVVEATSGGGAVTATMNGRKELLKIQIDPAAVAGLGGGQADVEMLQDLIVGAVNEAARKADEAIKSSVQGMLGGLKLPGMS
jgi:nucleoid-associated protein EbfC